MVINRSDRSFFTFATGGKYLQLAFALARSYRFHNGAQIPFFILSNENFQLPADLKWVKKVIYPKSRTGQFLEFKLHLLDLAPTYESIFIDSDSLIYDRIDTLFDQFDGLMPSVIGTQVTEGEWVDEQIAITCREYDLEYMIRFCGAFYYLVKTSAAQKLFEFAWKLHLSGRKFQRNDRTIYDEPILSVALSKFRVGMLQDDGNIWGDLVHYDRRSPLNVFKSRPFFLNSPSSDNFKFWLPAGHYSPAILHVGSGNYNKNPWLFDALRLKLHYQFGLPVKVSDLLVTILIEPGYRLARTLFRKYGT